MSVQTAVPQLNTRSLLVGGLLVATGTTIAGIGASVLGSALLAAARDWAQSEQRRELVAKARLASAAAAEAWRAPAPREVVLPDARTPVTAP